MAENTVLTAERFSSGLTYREYIDQIAVNKDRFEEFYQRCQLSKEDNDFFKKASKLGASRVMVIGEAWCPDVMRGMPAAARVAEAAGMEMRVFPRDKNLDVMNEFLKDGKHQSIPVIAFFNEELQELCRWIERPGIAEIERMNIEMAVKIEKPNATEQEIRQEVGARTRVRQNDWQIESVNEWKLLLAEKLGI